MDEKETQTGEFYDFFNKMSVSQAIASQIRYLRRFARALTASQAGGDAYGSPRWKRLSRTRAFSRQQAMCGRRFIVFS
jgi:hypothetical protein